MNDVSTLRLYVMRALYLLIAVGLGSIMWPRMLHHGHWTDMQGAGFALLSALSLLMALGLRYPLQMLPALVFELTWKTVWILFVGLPLWRTHQLDPDDLATFHQCAAGVVLCVVAIPWGYVWTHYVLKRGDRWSSGRPSAASSV